MGKNTSPEQEKKTETQPSTEGAALGAQETVSQTDVNVRGEESGNDAPANLFTKSAGKEASQAKEDPVAVRLIIQQLDEYAAKCGKGSGETTEARQATHSLHVAIRTMCTLKGASLKKVFKHLYVLIKENKTGAFTVPMPLRWAADISGENERKNFAMFMGLVIQYARLEDPKYIHERSDVKRVLSFIKDQDIHNSMLSQFASK